MKIKKVINFLVNSILILSLVFTGAVIVSTQMSGGKTNLFGYEILTVLSGSMEPGIKTGSIIAIKPGEDVTSFHKDDVITYRSPEQKELLITHRIVESKVMDSQVHYITKGDNNEAIDPTPIPANHVVGKYAGITIPFLGYFFSFVKSKAGIIALVILPGIILIVWQMVSIWFAISRMDGKKEKADDELNDVNKSSEPIVNN